MFAGRSTARVTPGVPGSGKVTVRRPWPKNLALPFEPRAGCRNQLEYRRFKAKSPRGDAGGGAWPMPIFRYFVFVGGALLALLFAADYVLPSQPVARAIVTASNDQPLIRIRSDRHLPERVVLDTSQPTIAAPAVKTAAVVVPLPPVQEAASPELAAQSTCEYRAGSRPRSAGSCRGQRCRRHAATGLADTLASCRSRMEQTADRVFA